MNEIDSASAHQRVALIVVAILMATSAFLSVASTAALAAPKGIFARFAQCPTSIPGVALCQYVEIMSGEFAIGPMRVPVEKTIVFQSGAVHASQESLNEYFLLPAANGESVSPTELDVPGGLRSIIDCEGIEGGDFAGAFRRDACRGFSHGRANDLTAMMEPVANASNPAILELAAAAFEEGPALIFPARIHLKNPFLGDACYLGSEAHPIELRLTTGPTAPPPPNEPIKGKAGKFSEEDENGLSITVVKEDTLVDNAFSVPPAEGCGGPLASRIDPLIDQTLGLESPAGHNTAILSGTHRIARADAVRASEAFPTEENPPPPPPPHHHRHHHHHHWWSAR